MSETGTKEPSLIAAILVSGLIFLSILGSYSAVLTVWDRPYYAFGHDETILSFVARGFALIAALTTLMRWSDRYTSAYSIVSFRAVLVGFNFLLLFQAFLNVMAYLNSTGTERNSWSVPSQPSVAEPLIAISYTLLVISISLPVFLGRKSLKLVFLFVLSGLAAIGMSFEKTGDPAGLVLLIFLLLAASLAGRLNNQD
ncbi:hypothetical protein [Gimibacter soli]|uniref:Uncharacterized protein n=1 Tax=Gimibacter soli TaxID=3024400 RepID=A0AAF0BLS8_9PROT|nr:hypothetical protein [Gimibacter soli]WCL53820.1 hypothetical protein PH603_14875 [Gimibacter soli]